MSGAQKIRRSSSKSGMNPIVSIAIILLVLVGGYFGGKSLGWWGATVAPPAPTPTDVDYFTFSVTELKTGVEIEDFNVTEYQYEVLTSDDAEDLAELVFADFTALTIEAADADEEFEQDTDFVQLYLISATGYSSKWVNPVLGENLVSIANQSADINIIAMETDGGSVTVNNTVEDEWTVMYKATTTDVDYPEGWDSANYDFEHDVFNYIAVRVTFNTTASMTWADCEDAIDEVATGSTLIFYIAGRSMLGQRIHASGASLFAQIRLLLRFCVSKRGTDSNRIYQYR